LNHELKYALSCVDKLSMKRIFLVFILGLVSLLSSACSVQGDITDLSIRNRFLNSAPTLGLSSGSYNGTVDGYQVSVSIGSHHSGMTSQVDGYTVYMSVQGQMASDIETTTVE
jgi:hypothetical protein